MFLQRIQRRMLQNAFAFALVLLLLTSAVGQPPEDATELDRRIDRLIQHLDLDDLRPAAAASLAKIGRAAVPKLREALERTPVDQRPRILDVLKVVARADAGLRFVSQLNHTGLNGAVTVALSPDGRFAYVPGHIAAAVNVFRRNSLSGALEVQQTLVDREQMDGVVSVRLNSTGELAVAAACRAKTIALYSRDAASGELAVLAMRRNEPGGELTMEWPIGAVFSTDSKFVYAIDDRRGTVLVFRVGPKRELSLVEIFAGADGVLVGPRGIHAHPDGKTLYVNCNKSGTLVVLNCDRDTGKVNIRQVLRDEEDGIHGLAGTIETLASRDGRFVYTVSGRFAGDDAIDAFQVGEDGKLSLLQEFINDESELTDFEGGAVGIAISPDGTRFYASGTRSKSLACFDRDPETGKLTFRTTLQSEGTGKDANLGANGIEISADGRFLYLALENASALSVFERTIANERP